jgi:hypothetical protein
MNLSPIERIREKFGWEGFPDYLFYDAEYALRFDLGGDLPENPIRFLQAVDRARQVAKVAFRQSTKLTAIVAFYDGERRCSRPAASFRALASIGFKGTFGPPVRVLLNDKDYIAQFGSDICIYWTSAEMEVCDAQIGALVWASVSTKLNISPKARWLDRIYIVDFDQGIVLLTYDDRGLDLVSLDREMLCPMYSEYQDWLLAYDRAKMDAMFGVAD